MEVIGGVQTRTKYLEYQKWADGIVLVPAYTPNGVDIPAEMLEAMALDPERVMIRDSCWTATQLLYTACLEKDTRGEGWGVDSVTEVMVMFARDPLDGHVIVAAPRQVVGAARVVTDLTKGLVNLITGEEYTVWPPDGFISFGDSHSHNRMGAFFSGVDDADELSKPGFHIVAGEYQKVNGEWQYKLALSIVAGGKRYKRKLNLDTMEVTDMVSADFITMNWRQDIELHPKVWEYVSTKYPEGWKDKAGEDTFGRKSKFELVLATKPRNVYEPDWDNGWPKTGYTYEDLYRAMQKRQDEADDIVEIDLADDVIDEVTQEMDALLQGRPIDLPGQQHLFPGASDNTPKTPSWERKYLKMEIEAMWDAMQRVLALCGDENKAKILLATALNYTGYFKRVKARRLKDTKGK